jgi:hypothetical protein
MMAKISGLDADFADFVALGQGVRSSYVSRFPGDLAADMQGTYEAKDEINGWEGCYICTIQSM